MSPRQLIAGLSRACQYLSMGCLLALVLALLFEVVARYGFAASTIWVNDVATFLTGTTFLLACAWVQFSNANIRIDAFSRFFTPRFRAFVEALFLVAFVLPVISVLTWTALRRAHSAVMTGEVNVISAWAPLMWPFFGALALALTALWLQCLVSLHDETAALFSRASNSGTDASTDGARPADRGEP